MSNNSSLYILAVNPGGTSTKVALFRGSRLIMNENIIHQAEDLKEYAAMYDQYPYRLKMIWDVLAAEKIEVGQIKAVVGRGGLLKPISGGVYAVNEAMVEDMKNAVLGEHASNLGAIIADEIGKKLNIPAYIVDPVAVDEMDDVFRISGLPEIPRVSYFHALNHKAVAKKAAAQLNKKYEDITCVIAHLGSGVSVGTHKNGRVIDVNDSKDEGPFAIDRCGGLPTFQLINLCFSGRYTQKELIKKVMGEGGIFAYLGTKDMREVEKMCRDGNKQARLVLEAYVMQNAKQIAGAAAVVDGALDCIVLTGGIAHSEYITGMLKQKISFIAPLIIIPGEDEMTAMAEGVLRVLNGEEETGKY